MHSKLLIFACLLGAAAAAPGGSKTKTWAGKKPTPSPTWTATPSPRPLLVDANFDNLTAGLADTSPVGIYDYLDYVGFSVGSEYIAGTQIYGVKPHSPPNVAYSDAISELFAGPSMQANYTGSKTKAFDFKSFYYACVGVTVNPTTAAENCTITVTGYQGEELVANQTFFYGQDDLPNPNLDATMNFGKLNGDFVSLTQVNFTYTNTREIDTPPSFLGDDFVYDVYLEGEWSNGKEWSS